MPGRGGGGAGWRHFLGRARRHRELSATIVVGGLGGGGCGPAAGTPVRLRGRFSGPRAVPPSSPPPATSEAAEMSPGPGQRLGPGPCFSRQPQRAVASAPGGFLHRAPLLSRVPRKLPAGGSGAAPPPPCSTRVQSFPGKSHGGGREGCAGWCGVIIKLLIKGGGKHWQLRSFSSSRACSGNPGGSASLRPRGRNPSSVHPDRACESQASPQCVAEAGVCPGVLRSNNF